MDLADLDAVRDDMALLLESWIARTVTKARSILGSVSPVVLRFSVDS
jgi:hypothetical protein